MIGRMVDRALRGEDPRNADTRRRCGTLAGAVGVGLNLLLFLGKAIGGWMIGSVAMVADGVNNLSDAGTSLVTLAGFRLANQKADREHPFGHGRVEYLAGLAVAGAILLMGVEVGRTAVSALLHPAVVERTPAAVAVLVISMAVKLWMYFFQRAMGRALDSRAMQATAVDSISDVGATGVVLLATLIGDASTLPADGLAGLLVALMVLKAGVDTARETVDPLLGRPMDPELAARVEELILSHPDVLGIHDLVYHDYGPGRVMMSLHAEVPADGNFLELHDMVDGIERELMDRFRIETVIHLDPVVRDENTELLRRQVEQLARELEASITVHDFRMTAGPNHTNLIFDVVVPYRFAMDDAQVCAELDRRIKQLSPRYFTVIRVDHSFVGERGVPR